MKYLILSLILTGCGVTCTHTLERPREIKAGPLETLVCGPGEVLGSAVPVYEPGGKVLYVRGTCYVMGCL